MLSDQFIQIFRDEHRKIRDTLLALIRAFEERDKNRIKSLFIQAATFTRPHFRYEEEALYPALTGIFVEEYIEKLLGDHDRAIGIAIKLVEIAEKEPLTSDDVAKAVQLIRRVLPHVSNCDGLSIMTETFPDEEIKMVLDRRESANQAGLDLLTWADQVRTRPLVIAE